MMTGGGQHVQVSVIVPLYNKAGTVERSLRSIAAQTIEDFEVLIVDDGSTDCGCEVALEFDHGRFRVIRQANAGPGAARNRGIAEARGEYLAFLDADDEWLPTYLEHGLGILRRTPRAAAVCCLRYDAPGMRSPAHLARRLRAGLHEMTPESSPDYFIELLAAFQPPTTIIRTGIARSMGGFYDRDHCLYGEDAHLWMKVFLNAPVWFSHEHLTVVHCEDSGLSRNLRRMRPIEPFLRDPVDVRGACPPRLLPLLEAVLATRAMKTATLLAYWGQLDDARELREKFAAPRQSGLRWRRVSWIATTQPFSSGFSLVANVHRHLLRRTR